MPLMVLELGDKASLHQPGRGRGTGPDSDKTSQADSADATKGPPLGGYSAGDRLNIQVLAQGLPEPVDLDVNAESRTLCWTNRGKLPLGGLHEHEAIGVKLDVKDKHVHLTDLGSSVHRWGADGGNRTIVFENSSMALMDFELCENWWGCTI
ncbi:hypothetical protein N657DRAFT_693641 [Parathielavia appendiculata]|uniref:Uncharacterized protein n=1 Tax=Parathielavia appendiculata TaxID=2587402 RepID=A0AAN6TS03_9PEZI|nr:hypothetical protein N657DRAFT_693641 [Parathielavia appendiculata]